MDATIEEFGKLYPAYATLYFKDECEIVETARKQSLWAVLRTLIKIYTFAPNFKFGTK